MKPGRIAILAFFTILLSFSSLGLARDKHEGDVHLTLYECTVCHVKTPVAGDNIVTAPLIKDTQALCFDCHGGE